MPDMEMEVRETFSDNGDLLEPSELDHTAPPLEHRQFLETTVITDVNLSVMHSDVRNVSSVYLQDQRAGPLPTCELYICSISHNSDVLCHFDRLSL